MVVCKSRLFFFSGLVLHLLFYWILFCVSLCGLILLLHSADIMIACQHLSVPLLKYGQSRRGVDSLLPMRRGKVVFFFFLSSLGFTRLCGPNKLALAHFFVVLLSLIKIIMIGISITSHQGHRWHRAGGQHINFCLPEGSIVPRAFGFQFGESGNLASSCWVPYFIR